MQWIKEYEMGGTYSTPKGNVNAMGFGGKTWKEEIFGRPRRKWKDNSEVNREEVGWQSVDWTDHTQDKDKWRTVSNAVINLGVP